MCVWLLTLLYAVSKEQSCVYAGMEIVLGFRYLCCVEQCR